MIRSARLASSALLILLVAACGGGAPPATGPGGGVGGPGQGGSGNGGQSGASIDSCTILSDAEIQAGTGSAVVERETSMLRPDVFPSICDIQLDDGGSLTVSVRSSGGKSMYETSFEPFIGESYLTEAVTGLGDKAGRADEGTLMVLLGDVLFDIQYIGPRPDERNVVQYLAERVLAKLPCIATGCPPIAVPPGPTPGAPTPGPTQPTVGAGELPQTGAQARVVNLFSENGQPVTVDVYGYAWSDAEQREVSALVATVPYGQASEWFSPGSVESPFGGEPYTRVDIFRQGESGFTPLVGTSEFLGPETTTTIVVWQEEVFEGEDGAWIQTIYSKHPDYSIATAAPDAGLLISRYGGMLAEENEPTLYASVGDGCLESPFGRSIPEIPNAQPIGNDLVIPTGEWTLTVHDAPLGEIPTCDKPLGPGAPVSVGPGDRIMAFPYRLPGETQINLLVVPFDAP